MVCNDVYTYIYVQYDSAHIYIYIYYETMIWACLIVENSLKMEVSWKHDDGIRDLGMHHVWMNPHVQNIYLLVCGDRRGGQFRTKSQVKFRSHSTQCRLKKKQKKQKKGKVSKEEQAAALTELKEAESGVM